MPDWKLAAELAHRMGELWKSKPSPLKKRCGAEQKPECVEKWRVENKKWSNEYNKLRRAHKKAIK